MAITETARAFFEACETGKGWEVCKTWCAPDATFASQAEPLADVETLEAYCGWMAWLLGPVPNGRYELHAFATDPDNQTVCAFATFHGAHTGPGGPVDPTGKSTRTDYVYAMRFTDGKISHMNKIWNAGWAVRELGWG
jgi:ketosteroid isomerase-like protein